MGWGFSVSKTVDFDPKNGHIRAKNILIFALYNEISISYYGPTPEAQ
jgi:hypothetical protein